MTTGVNNTALGYAALCTLTTGDENVAVGKSALKNSTTSDNKTDFCPKCKL